jgi:hypothetical protein
MCRFHIGQVNAQEGGTKKRTFDHLLDTKDAAKNNEKKYISSSMVGNRSSSKDHAGPHRDIFT